MERLTPLQTTVAASTRKRFTQLAAQDGRSAASLLRSIVLQYIAKHSARTKSRA